MRHSAIYRQLAVILPLAGLSTPTSLAAASKPETAMEVIEVSHTRQAYRGNVDARELPQAVSELSVDFLDNLGITDFQHSLDFVSGTIRQNSFGGLWDSFAIRGFAGDENLPSAYLINGFSAGRGFSGNRDSSNIERIEVIKGPGSALYGRSEPGGTVNIITKKPSFTPEGHLEVTAGKFNTARLSGDITGGVTDGIAVRLNGAYENADSFRDTVETEKLALSPSLLVRLNDHTTLGYELELSRQETPFDRGVVVLDNVGTLPSSRFLGNPQDGPIDIDATGHQLELQHSLSGDWVLSAGLGYRESSLKGYSSDAELSAGRQTLYADGQTLNRQRRHRDYQAEDISARVELSGSGEWLGLTHNLLLGADIYDYELHSRQQRWRIAWGAGETTYAVNVHQPDYQLQPPQTQPNQDKLEEQQAYGLYLQDMLELSPHWKAQFGLRADRFEQDITNNLSGKTSSQSQSEISPRFGLVYQHSDSLTAYTSYAEGFRPNSGADVAGNAFAPEKSKSYEAGLKWSPITGQTQASLALFRAEKSNVLTADPVNSGFSAALGEAESQGLELDISTRFGDDTEVLLAYAYVDAHTSNDIINADWGIELPKGSRLINIAKHSGHLTLQHYREIGNYPAKLGISAQYVGDRLGETIDPSYELPAYTLINLFGTLSLTEELEIKAGIDNLFDEAYYLSSYSALWTMPGAPLTYRISAKYHF